MRLTSRFDGLVKITADPETLPAAESDAALVKRLRSGEANAVKELFYTYFDRLYSLVYHSVGNDNNAAEDIVQETFLSAMKSFSKFKGDSHVFTWLVGIAHHKIGDHYRRLKRDRRNSTPLPEDGDGHLELVDDGMSAADMVESAEVRLVVNQAMQSLPVDYRQVLLLKYVEEMSVSEISRVLRRSPKSVEGLLTRARRALKHSIRQVNI